MLRKWIENARDVGRNDYVEFGEPWGCLLELCEKCVLWALGPGHESSVPLGWVVDVDIGGGSNGLLSLLIRQHSLGVKLGLGGNHTSVIKSSRKWIGVDYIGCQPSSGREVEVQSLSCLGKRALGLR